MCHFVIFSIERCILAFFLGLVQLLFKSEIMKKLYVFVLILYDSFIPFKLFLRDQHFRLFHFVRSSFVNDPFRSFFSIVQIKKDFVCFENYCYFPIYFVLFLTKRSFSKIVCSIKKYIFGKIVCSVKNICF